MPTPSASTPEPISEPPDEPREAKPRSTYDYALLRVVPRVERGEFVNVGAVLFCRTRRFLRAALAVDDARLLAPAPDLDLAAVHRHLAALVRIAAGDPAAGPIARRPQAERFYSLVAPASAMIQPSPVHTGLCTDPAAALARILDELVRQPPPTARQPVP
jgi:hypothetical protein